MGTTCCQEIIKEKQIEINKDNYQNSSDIEELANNIAKDVENAAEQQRRGIIRRMVQSSQIIRLSTQRKDSTVYSKLVGAQICTQVVPASSDYNKSLMRRLEQEQNIPDQVFVNKGKYLASSSFSNGDKNRTSISLKK